MGTDPFASCRPTAVTESINTNVGFRLVAAVRFRYTKSEITQTCRCTREQAADSFMQIAASASDRLCGAARWC